jgi:alpha-L-rhamnosidase
VDYLTTRAPGHLVEYSYYGDWAPPISEGLPGSLGTSAVARNTPGQLVSTAFYAYSARLLSQIAGVLGQDDDASTYRELAVRIREAFNDYFWDEARGGYGTNNQACNSLALYMGLVPEKHEARVIANLVRDVEEYDCHLTTGNLCTKYVLEVLTDAGYGDIAFALAVQTSYPSWGYVLLNGATTMWERWEKATGRGMNSHNHPMFGSVGAWLYRVLAGIQVYAEGPGFGRISIRPYIPAGMKFARASLKTIRGRVESGWEVRDDGFLLRARIPVGSVAEIGIPKLDGRSAFRIQENGKTLWESGKTNEKSQGVLDICEERQAFILKLGSGQYQFLLKRLDE